MTTNEVEINTVDKYQGRDKEVIIVSFTHSQTGQDLHVSNIILFHSHLPNKEVIPTLLWQRTFFLMQCVWSIM